MENVDEMRICPDDPLGSQRFEDDETSYVLNSYLVSLDAFGIHNICGGVENINKIKATSKTIAMFEAAENVHEDHLHAFDWFSEGYVNQGTVFNQVSGEVAVDRHGTVANYLYLDGHVSAISTEQIQDWCNQPFNFAQPQK